MYYVMVWLKTEVDDDTDSDIEAFQENSDAENKVEAVRRLILHGLYAVDPEPDAADETEVPADD